MANITTWYGRRITSLSREDLYEVIEELGRTLAKVGSEPKRLSSNIILRTR